MDSPTQPQPSGQSKFVTALPTQTQVETGQPVAAGFWMVDYNYKRLKQRVDEIESQPQWPMNVGVALAALIPAIGLQLIPWLSTFPTLPEKVQLEWGWVSGAMVAALVFCVLGILLCAYAAYRSSGRRARDKASVLEDMNDVEQAARAHGMAGGQPVDGRDGDVVQLTSA